MNKVANNQLDGATSLQHDINRLKDANEVVKILKPAQVQELEALLTQSTVSKDDLKDAKQILSGALKLLDQDKDSIALNLAKEAGIDWKPGDGWRRETRGKLTAFGASAICLQGSVAILRGQFPNTLKDDLKDAALSAGRLLAAIPIGIAVGLAVMVSTITGKSDYNW